MSLCYRLLPGASIIPPSDLRLQILRLRPVSVRSALCDGISRALRDESRSRFSEPAVAPFQEGGWSFSRVRSRSAKGIGAIGEMIGELEVDLRRQKTAEVLAAAAVTVVLGTGNRVLYKLALVPLKEYPFFLAQFATFGYLVVYFSILYIRYQAGIVTDEMLSLPKARFLAVGLLEALAAASGMAAGAVLSGASIPILSQTFLVWQLLFSVAFLKRQFRLTQILGCFLVTIGVVITVTSGSGAGISLKNAGIFWSLLMILSFLLQAADTILKEIIFLDAAKKLKCRAETVETGETSRSSRRPAPERSRHHTHDNCDVLHDSWPQRRGCSTLQQQRRARIILSLSPRRRCATPRLLQRGRTTIAVMPEESRHPRSHG